MTSQHPASHSSSSPMLRTVAPGRSCAACKRRKIRCNRQQPCSYCAKLKGRCVYPAESRVEKVSKRPGGESGGEDEGEGGSDVQERLARIEELLLEMRAGQEVAATRAGLEERVSAERESMPGGSRVQNDATASGPSKQYDGGFWAAVGLAIGDSTTARGQLEQQTPSEPASTNTPPPPPLTPALPPHLRPYLPLPERILPLWLVYLDSVSPLLPILDVHKTQDQLLDFTAHLASTLPSSSISSSISPSLLFSVNHATTISLLSSTSRQHLPLTELRSAVARYARGLDLTWSLSLLPSASSVSLLTNPSFSALQALVLYIFSVRAYRPAGVVWALVGVARGVAMRLGLHREDRRRCGVESDCEVEVEQVELKRRLWCAIVVLDTWTAGEVGVDPGLLEYELDHRLWEGMGGAEVLFLRRAMELASLARRVLFSEGFMRANGYEVLEWEGRLEKIVELRERLRRGDVEGVSSLDSNVGMSLFVRKWTQLELSRMEVVLSLGSTRGEGISRGRKVLESVKEILRGLSDMRGDNVMKKYIWLVLRDGEWVATAAVLRQALGGAEVDEETWELAREALARWESFLKGDVGDGAEHVGGEVDDRWVTIKQMATEVEQVTGRRLGGE